MRLAKLILLAVLAVISLAAPPRNFAEKPYRNALVRFGRAAPMRSALVRFGKRAEIIPEFIEPAFSDEVPEY
ncbi:unnamed protein product, partial [Mesorhabditis belari]|uniref:Uncharacterized protein n=1 Tax=Mesorhabditis belari TaxID=2138241 RepID=A0AAF3EGS8_9BILA